MVCKRKVRTEIVPNEVPSTHETQPTLNETNMENQDAETIVEPNVSSKKKDYSQMFDPISKGKKQEVFGRPYAYTVIRNLEVT